MLYLVFIRTTARVLGTFWVIFIAYFLIVKVMGFGSDGMALSRWQDVITFVVYPLLTLLGLSLAWKWEGFGGALTLIATLGLLMIRPELIARWYLLIPLLPGSLYLLLFYKRRTAE